MSICTKVNPEALSKEKKDTTYPAPCRFGCVGTEQAIDTTEENRKINWSPTHAHTEWTEKGDRVGDD